MASFLPKIQPGECAAGQDVFASFPESYSTEILINLLGGIWSPSDAVNLCVDRAF